MNEIDDKYLLELAQVFNYLQKNKLNDIELASLSFKNDLNSFLINKKDSFLFDIDTTSFTELFFKKDYRWNDVGEYANIHQYIYENIKEAKYIYLSAPIYTLALSTKKEILQPLDYYGEKISKVIEIYRPTNPDTWDKTAKYEIANKLKSDKKNYIIIQGYGLCIYERDLTKLLKTALSIENSSKILYLNSNF